MFYQTPMYQTVPQQVATPMPPVIATPMPQQQFAQMIATPMPQQQMAPPMIATPMPQPAPMIATPMPQPTQVIATPLPPQPAFQPFLRPPMQQMYIAQPGIPAMQPMPMQPMSMQPMPMQQPIIYMQPPMPQITEYDDEPQDINIQIVRQKQKNQKFVHHYFDK